MYRFLLSLIISIFFLLAVTCKQDCPNAEDCPREPSIVFKNLRISSEHDSYIDDPRIDSRPRDSIHIILEFKDGNGDLGGKSDNNSDIFVSNDRGCLIGALGDTSIAGDNLDTVQANAFLIDQRTGCKQSYTIPHIPSQSRIKAISGEIEISKLGESCRHLPPNRKFDTLRYRVYIQDREGNNSDTITTTPIVIRCRK